MKPTILPRKYKATEVQQSFSWVTGFYDLWSYLTERKAVKRALQLARIEDGEDILEVAMGTGIVFEEIIKHNPNGHNEGLDLSPQMLSKAVNRLDDYVIKPFHLQVGSSYNLPFANNSFDLIINNYMFDLLPESDFKTILTEFKRVVKPGGRIVITTFSFGTDWYHHIWFWIARYLPTLLTWCRPITLENYALEADFRDIDLEEISQNTFPSTVIKMKKSKPDVSH